MAIFYSTGDISAFVAYSYFDAVVSLWVLYSVFFILRKNILYLLVKTILFETSYKWTKEHVAWIEKLVHKKLMSNQS